MKPEARTPLLPGSCPAIVGGNSNKPTSLVSRLLKNRAQAKYGAQDKENTKDAPKEETNLIGFGVKRQRNQQLAVNQAFELSIDSE